MKHIVKAFPALSVLSLALLTACGGGGSSNGSPSDGSNNGGTTPTTTTFAGTVIDGYIEGATVCLDLNANLLCDSDEPKATTKADGAYSLDVTGLATDKLKLAHLVTVVPATAKDADDGGKTLAEAGKSGFSLLAPAAAYVKADGSSVTGAVISPLTTLVSHEMISGNNNLDTSEKYVRERLSLAVNTDLRQDFVAKKDAALTEKAQMLAVAIGGVKAAALADTVSKATDKDALLAALTYLQTEAANLQAEYAKAKQTNSTAKPVELVKAALKTDAAKPVTANLVAEAKKISNSTLASSVVAIIEQGFYSADHVLENCGTANANYSCTPGYFKVQGSGGKIISDRDYSLVGSSWSQANNTNMDLVLTSSGWVSEDCPAGQSISYAADSNGSAVLNFCNGRAEKASGRTVDASGQTLAALGLNAPAGFEGLTMPSGSQLYWFDFSSSQDRYNLWTGNKVTKWVWNPQTNSGSDVPFTSLAEFIDHYSTANAAQGTRFGWSGLQFSFDAGGTSAGGTVTLWSSYQSNATKTGSATYERRMVNGQEILVIKAQAPDNDNGDLVMFAVKDGYLYGGHFRLASAKNSSNPLFNKTMINAILKAGNKPAVLD